MDKKYSVLCYTNAKISPPKILFFQNDTNVCKIEFPIYEGQDDPLLDIVSASLDIVKPDNTESTFSSLGPTPALTISDNVVTFLLPLIAIQLDGQYSGELHVYGADGQRQTVSQFTYKITPELVNSSTPIEDDRYPILTDMMETINVLDATMTGNETLRQEKSDEQQVNEDLRIDHEDDRVANENIRQSNETQRITSETSRGSAETGRVNAENIRVSSENTRISSEASRVSAEGVRATAENNRVTAETNRATAEASRVTVEAQRVTNETARATAETGRSSAEASRVTAENARVSSENTRITNEGNRTTTESARVTAESSRASAESGRVSAEQSRVTTESARVNAENTRATEYNNRVNNENTRISQENARVSAETARASAESTRQSQETTRQSQEAARQSSFTTITNAYNAATTANTAVELTAARHDNVQNKDFATAGARLDDMTSTVLRRASAIVEAIPSGFAKLSDIDHTYDSTNPNSIKLLTDSIAYVNGFKITIPAATVVTLSAPPADVPRDDLVFLEVWLDSVTGQPQYRIHADIGIDFTTYPEGITHFSIVKARGGNASETTYTFTQQTSTDIGLYRTGTGSTGDKTALATYDGYVYAIPMFKVSRRPSCGYASSDEYLKFSPLQNPIHTQRVLDNTNVKSGQDGLKITVEAHTLNNLTGDAGNCEDLSKWGNHGVTLDTSIKLYGNSSFKCVDVDSADAHYLDKNIICDQTHKYLLSGYAYISSFTSGTAPVIRAYDYGTVVNNTDALFDTTKLNQWQRKSVIVTGKANGGITLFVGNNGSTIATVNIDGVMLYDLTQIYGAGNEPSDIPTLERALPFVSGLQSSKAVALTAKGKNLFNKDDVTKGYYINDTSGSLSSSVGSNVSNYIPIKSGINYAMTFPVTSQRWGAFFTADKTYISGFSGVASFTSPSNAKYVRITVVDSNLDGFQIEEGSAATAYQPCKASEVILPSNFTDSLKEISSTVKDSIDIQRLKVVKKVESIVLNGQEIWVVSNTLTNTIQFSVSVLNYKSQAGGLSDKFANKPNITDDTEGLYFGNSYVNIFILKSKLSTQDVAGFKAWLLQNPVTVYYELATPIEYDISDFLKGRFYVNPELTTVEVNQVSTSKVIPKANPNAVSNGDFSNGTTGWNVTNGSLSVNSNVLSLTANGASLASGVGYNTTNACVTGNKVYIRCIAKLKNSNCTSLRLYLMGTTGGLTVKDISNPTIDVAYLDSSVFTVSAGITGNIKVYIEQNYVDAATANGKIAEFQQVYAVDLTAMFGAGNEPSQSWCDQYLEFGTNYTLTAPTGATALGILRDGKDTFKGCQGQVAVVPASKWKDGMYELFYREASETHVPPRVVINAGSLTLDIKDSATVGSIPLTTTEVGYKKHTDGAINYGAYSGTSLSSGPATVVQGIEYEFSYSSLAVEAQVGDYLEVTGIPYSWQITDINPSANKLKAVRLVLGTSLTYPQSAYKLFKNPRRYDSLYSNIIADRDILDLRHLVSLTGFNYQSMLEENIDKLLRGELQTKDRIKQKKTYVGIPKTPVDDNTVFYASFDGTTVAEVGGSPLSSGGTILYKPTWTGLGFEFSGYTSTSSTSNMKYKLGNPLSKALTIDLCFKGNGINNATGCNIIGIGMDADLNNSITISINSGNLMLWYNGGSKTLLGGLNLSAAYHLRFTYNDGAINCYINGVLIHTSTITIQNIGVYDIAFIGLTGSSRFNPEYISDLMISNIDRGNYFPTLPKDFIDGKAVIAPALNNQRKTFGDPLMSQYTMGLVKAYDTDRPKQQTVTQATQGAWASTDTIKIKGLAGEVISGVIDSDTALAKLVKNTNGSENILYLDDVSKLAVNDNIVLYDVTNKIGYSGYSVTAIDTTNKTITINTAAGLSSGEWLIIETTTSSSSPIVKFNNSGTMTTVTGTWSNLGTNEATFTLGTNASLTSQDIQIEYSLNAPAGQGQIDVYSKTLGGEVNGRKLVSGTVVIRDDFAGKISGNVVECPHIAKSVNWMTSLQTPNGSFSELSNSQLPFITSLNSSSQGFSSTTNGVITQMLFSFNLIRMVEDKLGMKIPSADPVQWLKDNLNKITANAYIYGSCPSGNKAYIALWASNIPQWAVSGWTGYATNSSPSPTALSPYTTNPTNYIDANGFCHFLAYTDASDGVAASTIYTDYIYLDIELKTPTGYDVLVSENPRRDENWKVTTKDLTVTNDYSGKISGSTVENPHISKGVDNSSSTLLIPSSGTFTESTQTEVDKIKTLGGVSASRTATTNGNIPQQLFSEDVIAQIERKYGTIPAKDLASKIAWAKSYINNIVFNWYGYGSGPSGNKAYLAIWGNPSWVDTVNNTASSVSLLPRTESGSSIPLVIDSNGYFHALAYTDASDGVTASVINSDYVSFDVVLKPEAVLLMKYFNNRVKRSNVLLVRKETKEVQTFFGGNNEDKVVVVGEVVSKQSLKVSATNLTGGYIYNLKSVLTSLSTRISSGAVYNAKTKFDLLDDFSIIDTSISSALTNGLQLLSGSAISNLASHTIFADILGNHYGYKTAKVGKIVAISDTNIKIDDTNTLLYLFVDNSKVSNAIAQYVTLLCMLTKDANGMLYLVLASNNSKNTLTLDGAGARIVAYQLSNRPIQK